MVLAALLLAGSLFAQQQTQVAPATQPNQPMNISVSVGYVMVPFVATDDEGHTIKKLRAKDVELYVDGRRVSTDLFDRSDNAPVSFTILLDASGSMALAGKMQGAIAAIDGIVSHRVQGDDYTLYTFANDEVLEKVPFTRDGQKILEAARSTEPWGKTAFYDALALMPDKTILGQNGARCIVLLTDALDNASTMTRTQLTAALEGVDVPVYPLGLLLSSVPAADPDANPETLSDVETLEAIAHTSGGKMFLGTDPASIGRAIQQIQQDLRTQYLVGFTPTGKGVVKYRAIALRLPRAAKVVRVRAGYRGTEPPLVAGAKPLPPEKGKKKERKGSHG